MQTIRGQKVITPKGFDSPYSSPDALSIDNTKRLKIREFISWSVCFAIVAGLTGLLKFLKLGVTMETITSSLFYLSLAGLVFFISRIFRLSKNPSGIERRGIHELN